MPMPLTLRAMLLSLAFVAVVPGTTQVAPITPGTVFLDPDIITSSDPTSFLGLSYRGTGSVMMFDRRTGAFGFVNAFLFDAAFSDGLTTQIQVNPEFGSAGNAQIEAAKYGWAIGQLPNALRVDVETVWIHRGRYPFGGGNHNILIRYGSGRRVRRRRLPRGGVHPRGRAYLARRHACRISGMARGSGRGREFRLDIREGQSYSGGRRREPLAVARVEAPGRSDRRAARARYCAGDSQPFGVFRRSPLRAVSHRSGRARA